MPKLYPPRAAKTLTDTRITRADIPTESRRLLRKSKFVALIRFDIVTRLRTPLAMAQLKQLRVTSSAENIDATMPIVSVTANPLTGPVALQHRISAVMSVVMFESKMALNALSYAAVMAALSGLPAASSSRIRS